MQLLSTPSLRNQIAGNPSVSAPKPVSGQVSGLKPLTELVPADASLSLPPWIADTFAARYASDFLQRAGHTAVGQAVRSVLDDPFVYLHEMKIGGIRDNLSAACASIAGSAAPTRLAGTVVGATIGALTGAGQALMTFPGTGTVVVGTLHGLVVGATAGNVAVLESRNRRQAVLSPAQKLW